MLELNLNEFGEVGNFNFTLNAATDFPGTLVEIAFLSNIDEKKEYWTRALNVRLQKKFTRV